MDLIATSTDTLAKEDKLRVHGHMSCETQARKMHVMTARALAFRGVQGFLSQGGLQQVGTKGATRNAAGHYDLLMPKVGGMLSYSPLVPLRDFRVSPDWIEAFVASGRMSFSSAAIEIARQGGRASHCQPAGNGFWPTANMPRPCMMHVVGPFMPHGGRGNAFR